MKGLVNETTLVSPVCSSKLVGEGEIELARGEGSGAAVYKWWYWGGGLARV